MLLAAQCEYTLRREAPNRPKGSVQPVKSSLWTCDPRSVVGYKDRRHCRPCAAQSILLRRISVNVDLISRRIPNARRTDCISRCVRAAGRSKRGLRYIASGYSCSVIRKDDCIGDCGLHSSALCSSSLSRSVIRYSKILWLDCDLIIRWWRSSECSISRRLARETPVTLNGTVEHC